MELTEKEIYTLYRGLEFMLESITNDFEDKEMCELYKDDIKLMNKVYNETN